MDGKRRVFGVLRPPPLTHGNDRTRAEALARDCPVRLAPRRVVFQQAEAGAYSVTGMPSATYLVFYGGCPVRCVG